MEPSSAGLTRLLHVKMEMTRKTGIVLVINIVLMISLLIALLFLVQKGAVRTESIEELAGQALLEKNARELYTEATAENPYFIGHPEELALTEIKIADFRFTDIKGLENTQKEYGSGEDIPISLSVYDYMNPKVADHNYVYGIKIWAETVDTDGNNIKSLSGLAVDTAAHNLVKGMKVPFNILLTPDSSVKPGKYKVKITAFDTISKIQAVQEEEFTII
jgi:hypothetical protein